MALSFAGPLFLSFDKKVAFYKSFVPLIKATLPVALLFIGWDILFTAVGVWGFNSKYITGITLAGLPMGEYLFFLVIPYCCVFIYEVLKAYFPKSTMQRPVGAISNFLIGFSIVLAILFYDRLYTVINFAMLAIVIFYFSRKQRAPWLGRFYQAFLVICIPFFIVNSILTGTFLQEEIVWYNAQSIMGIRLGTIPVEDLFYALSQILLTVNLYERYKSR